MIKRLLIAIVLLAIVAGGLIGFNIYRDRLIENIFANLPVPVVTVSTVTAEPGSWTPSIDAIGTVSAARGVDLTVETTGIVKEINFTANQTVEAGQVLVQLDDAVQQADLEAARTQNVLDKQALQRALELQQRGVGSTVALQSAEAAAAASGAQVEKLQAVLQQKQLRAPFGGVVGIPRIDEGQYLTPGATVVTIQDITTMRADFTVPEQQLSQLKIGQDVRLRIDGQEETFSGEIVGIDPKVDPSSRLVSVRATIDNPNGAITPGQFVRIHVQLPAEDGVIALPQTAVVTSLYGDYVYVVRPVEGDEEGKQESRQIFVEVGRRSEGRVEIKSGLDAGSVVVTAGQNRLNNGSPVAIDNTIDPSGRAQSQASAQ